MPINKQPIFTATPILRHLQFDPAITTVLYDTSDATAIYEDLSTYGSLITKVTVNSPVRQSGGKVAIKRIYLMVSDIDNPTRFNLLDSKLMQGLSSYDPASMDPPSVVFEFPTGLITSSGTVLAIASTTNEAVSSNVGDRVVVIVEGGTYDQPS